MLLYRITKEKYLDNLSGLGSSYLNGARWNSRGFPVIYFALTPSVALLEMANYLPSPRTIPGSIRLGIYKLADSTSRETLSIDNMPLDWNEFPYPYSTQEIGSEWLASLRSLCLFVPSTASPAGLENIVVVNPLHPEIKNIKLDRVVLDLYNKRIFKGIN